MGFSTVGSIYNAYKTEEQKMQEEQTDKHVSDREHAGTLGVQGALQRFLGALETGPRREKPWSSEFLRDDGS